MRWLWLAVVLGCGGPSDATLVVDLPASDQQSLCADFVDSICAKPDFASFCDACATGAGCAMAISGGAVDLECDLAPNGNLITVGMVRDCASTGDFTICQQGGGCMFDAIEAVCP